VRLFQRAVAAKGLKFCGRPCCVRYSVEAVRLIEKAQANLTQLRAEGRDPTKRPKKRGAANRAVWRVPGLGDQTRPDSKRPDVDVPSLPATSVRAK
jgi:hypothetical protein